MKMFITNHLGVVHTVRPNGVTCPEATRTMRRTYVTPVQCLVYKLPYCQVCWTKEFTYDYHIRYAYHFNKEDT